MTWEPLHVGGFLPPPNISTSNLERAHAPKVKVSPSYELEVRQDGKAISAGQIKSGPSMDHISYHPPTCPHPELLQLDPSPPFPSRKRKGWQVGRWVGKERAKLPFYHPTEQTD